MSAGFRSYNTYIASGTLGIAVNNSLISNLPGGIQPVLGIQLSLTGASILNANENYSLPWFWESTDPITLYIFGASYVGSKIWIEDGYGNLLTPVATYPAFAAVSLTPSANGNFINIIPAVNIPTSATFLFLAAAQILPLSYFILLANIRADSLQSGETMVISADSVTFNLNRVLTLGTSSYFSIMGPFLVNSTYTITSSNTALIPNMSGVVGVGSSYAFYADPLASGRFTGSLIFSLTGSGTLEGISLKGCGI